MQKIQIPEQPMGYWLAMFGKLTLAIAMLLYMGQHSLNFFGGTFKGGQTLFSWIGLLTTSLGFLIWLCIFMWGSPTTFERAIAFSMMGISLLGEFIVAGFDIFFNIANKNVEYSWTQGQLIVISAIIAGLALLNGLALVADFAGMEIMSLLAKKKSRAVATTDTEIPTLPPAIKIHTGAMYKRITWSDKTQAFYCHPDKVGVVEQYLAAPGRWESIAEFLETANKDLVSA